MRTRKVLVLGFLVALATAGCAKAAADDPGVASAGGNTPSASASASAAADDPDAPLKFAKCMREHGMTWFPDPSGGKLALKIPENVPKEKFEAAQEACRQYAPGGGEAPKMDAADLEKARQMAKCMRENGVPDFPDPKPDGSIEISGEGAGPGPGDATFEKAQKICDKYAPSGATSGRTTGKQP